MVKEIDNETAEILAKEISRSFAVNPNSRKGQVTTLVEIHHNKIPVLNYDTEDLLKNKIIRNKLFGDFRKIRKHPYRVGKNDKNLLKAFKKELDQGLRRARIELGK